MSLGVSYVRAPKSIAFSEPSRVHAKDKHGETVSDLAKLLEKKYSLLRNFVIRNKKEIKSIIVSEIKLAWKHSQSQVNTNNIIGEKIKNRWREYITRGETGIRTKAATERGSQSFIDTGDYYSAMNLRLT